MTSRELERELTKKFVKQSDGGLIIKDVKLLAEGTWTDSAYGTPCYYSELVLKEYADNWVDRSLWARHSGGVPRAITEKIGDIQNTHFAEASIMGDLVLHGRNQASKDTIEMVLAELVNYVSIEHAGQEHYDIDNDRYVAEELIMYGAAMVNIGACTTCTLNEQDPNHLAEANDKMTKELEAKLSEAESRIKELSDASVAKDTKLAELEAKLGEVDATLAKIVDIEEKIGTIAELEKKLETLVSAESMKELADRVEKIEKTPLPPETFGGGIDASNELSAIDPFVKDAEGFTRRMF